MKTKIKEYNKWLYQYDTSKLPIGLFEGKMGLCIYWYIQARCYKKEDYEAKASDLLDEIYEDLGNKTYPNDFENGIIGIAFAIDYLLENEFVKGNRDDVLGEVDDVIFRNLYYEHIDKRTKRSAVEVDELWAGIYFAKRLQNDKLSKEQEFLYKRILMEVINRVSSNVSSYINTEPIIFGPLAYVYLVFLVLLTETSKCLFYNKKLYLLIEEWKDDIKTLIPNSEGHKYIMWNLLSKLTQEVRTDSLHLYLEMIKQYMDISYFINNELHSRNIDLYNGISAWALYLLQNDVLDKDTLGIANKKIEDSVLWRDWAKNKEQNINQELVDNNAIQDLVQENIQEKEQIPNKTKVGLFTSLTGSIATYQIINGLCKR